MFQFVFEFGLLLLVVLTGLFQVLIPLAQNRKVFPIFRKDISKAEKALAETAQEVAVSKVLLEKEELEKKIYKKAPKQHSTNTKHRGK